MYKWSRQEFYNNNISYNNVITTISLDIFKTLAYLIMPEAYLKPCQHLWWWDILRSCHSQNSLFRHLQAYSGTFSNIQPCSGIVREIKAYWGIFSYCSGILRHIQIYSFRTLCNPCIYNHAIFRTLAHLEPEACLWNMKYVRWLGIFRALA